MVFKKVEEPEEFALLIDAISEPYVIQILNFKKQFDEEKGKIKFYAGPYEVPPPISYFVYQGKTMYPYVMFVDKEGNVHIAPTKIKLENVQEIVFPADLSKVREFYQQVIEDLSIPGQMEEVEKWSKYLFVALVFFGLIGLGILAWGFNNISESLKSLKIQVNIKQTPIQEQVTKNQTAKVKW